MVLNVHRNHKGRGEGGEQRGMEVVEEGVYIIYTYRYIHHQNDSCIKVGSDESHFNVSFGVSDKAPKDSVHRPQLLKRKDSRSGFEPRSICLSA